jgi:flagellar biosynthesis protein FlhG
MIFESSAIQKSCGSLKNNVTGGKRMATQYRTEDENTVEDSTETLEAEENENCQQGILKKPAKSQVICIASGKGGTGKTLISTNLAVLLAREGLKTILIDADFGLANAHLLLGMDPVHDISSVLSGEKEIEEIIMEGPEGMKLIPGGSGLSELSSLDDEKFLNLINQLRSLEDSADVIIIDLPAGISPQVMSLLGAAHEIIVVTTPEITSLVDAYALLKSLTTIFSQISPHIIVNRAPDKSRAVTAFQKLFNVSKKHLRQGITPKFLGWLPQNWYVINSVTSRRPLVLRHPLSFATESVEAMANKLVKRHEAWKKRQLDDFVFPSYFTRLEKIIYGRE